VNPLVEEITEGRVLELLRELNGALYDAVVNGRELIRYGIVSKEEVFGLIALQTHVDTALHRREIEKEVRA
jgi:hypothetical protein